MAMSAMPCWEESWWSTCSDLIPVFGSVMTRSKYRMVQQKIGCPMGALLVALPTQGGADVRRASGGGGRRRPRGRPRGRPRTRSRRRGLHPRSHSRLNRARRLRDVAQRPPRRALVKARQEQRRRLRQRADALELAAPAPAFTVSLEPPSPPSTPALPAEATPEDLHCGMPVLAEHLEESSSQAVALLTARCTGEVVKPDVQDSNEEANSNRLLEEAVSHTASSSTPEERFSNSSKVTQTPEILKSDLDSFHSRPMIIGPELYSGYAEVLYAGDSRSSGVGQMKTICGFQNSLIDDNKKDTVECVQTSASTNKLLDEMKSADVMRKFENSPSAQIYRTDSVDVKPVHIALAQTHLASRSVADTSGNNRSCEESFRVEEMITDSPEDFTSRYEVGDSISINNFEDQQTNVKKSEIQNKLVDSSVSGPMLVDSTIQPENEEADCTHISLACNLDGGSFKSQTVKPLSNDITVESSNLDAVAESSRIAPCQPIETQTPRTEVGFVDSSSAPPPKANHFPPAEADRVSPSNAYPATREPDLDAEVRSVHAGSEAETVDVETVPDETATVAWSIAETRGSLESMALEDMDVDVDVDGEEDGTQDAGVEVPDEWCDACRQRFSPAPDMATLSRRYRVAKWLSSLLGYVGLVSCDDDPDRVSMQMLGPPAMAPPSRARGFFF